MSQPEYPHKQQQRSARFLILALAAFIALACIWRFTSLHDKLSPEVLSQWGDRIRGHRWVVVAVPMAYVVAGLVGFSHAALVWATVFTFPVWQAFLYAEVGTLAGSFTVYGLGHILRRSLIERIAGSRLEEISEAAGRNAILTLFILHIFPIAPNSVLNLAAGASHIKWKDFLVGTILGASPGIIVVCVFGHRLLQTIEHPGVGNFALLGLYLILAWATLRELRDKLLKS